MWVQPQLSWQKFLLFKVQLKIVRVKSDFNIFLMSCVNEHALSFPKDTWEEWRLLKRMEQSLIFKQWNGFYKDFQVVSEISSLL